MIILTLTCNQCGTSLDVPSEETRFLICTTCSSQLEVHRSGGTPHAEVLGATETVNPELELENLAREWEKELERHGPVGTLKLLQHVMWLVMIVGLALAGYGVSVDMKHLGGPGPGPTPYVCMFLGAFLVLGWIVFFLFTGDHRRRVGLYELAEQSYRYQRYRLCEEIDASAKGANVIEGNDLSPR